MNRLSLNARTAVDAEASAEVEVLLMQFEHPALSSPVRLSTDPTERISAEPLVYGTRSTWNGADPAADPYLFLLAAAELPSDLEDAAPGAVIVLDNVSSRIGRTLRSFLRPRASVHLAVVLATSPDLVEIEFRDLLLVDFSMSDEEVRLTISRQQITEEAAPTDRMTRDRFPGLFR